MEGISSSLQNSDQTDSYFRTGFGSKKVSDDSKNNDGSNSESKEKEEEKTPPNQDLAHDLQSHIDYPYPTEDERIQLCRETGLSRKQLRVWFINSRKWASVATTTRMMCTVLVKKVKTHANEMNKRESKVISRMLENKKDSSKLWDTPSVTIISNSPHTAPVSDSRPVERK